MHDDLVDPEFVAKIERMEGRIKGQRYCPNCHSKLSTLIVKRESPNQGRPFMMCELCESEGTNCFWWLDQGDCECGNPYVLGTVKKEGKNKGRRFRTCALGSKCYFKWLSR